MKLDYMYIIRLFVVLACILGPTRSSIIRGAEKVRTTTSKSLNINGKSMQVEARLSEEQPYVEIAASTLASGSSNIVTEIFTTYSPRESPPNSIDFTVSSDGEMLWTVMPVDDARQGGITYRVYPLAKSKNPNGDRYRILMHARKYSEDGEQQEKQVCTYLNLSYAIRQHAIAKAKKGEGLELGRGAVMSNVKIESDEKGAVVSGSLGKYTFLVRIHVLKYNKMAISELDIQPAK